MINWFKKHIFREDVRPVYDIKTREFHDLAFKKTGLTWDFSKLEDYSVCCVTDCCRGRLWGHWTCGYHKQIELDNFDPVDEFGGLFYSHKGKNLNPKQLRREG